MNSDKQILTLSNSRKRRDLLNNIILQGTSSDDDDNSNENENTSKDKNIDIDINKNNKHNKESNIKDKDQKEEDDTINDKNLLSYEELMRDPELYHVENAKARQRKSKLFLLDSIGKTLNVLVYTFVISSICLQIVGYGFVIDTIDGSLNGSPSNTGLASGGIRFGNVRIVTLENQAFVMEMRGKDEQAARIRKKIKGYDATTTTMTTSGNVIGSNSGSGSSSSSGSSSDNESGNNNNNIGNSFEQ